MVGPQNNPSLNLGRYTIRVPDPDPRPTVGIFWRQQQETISSEDPNKTDDRDNGEKLVSQVEVTQISTDLLSNHPRESITTQSNFTYETRTSESFLDGILVDDDEAMIGSERDGSKRSFDSPRSGITSILDNCPTQMDTQRSNVTKYDKVDTYESVVVSVDPLRYIDAQSISDSNLSQVNSNESDGLCKSLLKGEKIPRQTSKKVYPKDLPYNKIMSHVTFVMSGFENPRRAHLRDKAISMGAKYQAKWNRFCTHLICAFKNTPKYKEVMAENGRVVREHWIQECDKRRQLVDWRKYKLGKYPYPDSEEEVDVNDLDYARNASSGLKRRRVR